MVQATPAPMLTTPHKAWLLLPFSLAALFTAMVLVQLFDFEQFVARTASYVGWQETTIGIILAVFVVAVQVFAVPFLLRLDLSPLARFISALCVLLAPALWLVLALYATLQNSSLVECSCLFRIDIGWGHVAINALFLILAVTSFTILNGARALKLQNK